MFRFVRRLIGSETGATAVEYGLIVALIAVVIITAVTAVGTAISSTFHNVATNVAAAGSLIPSLDGPHREYRVAKGTSARPNRRRRRPGTLCYPVKGRPRHTIRSSTPFCSPKQRRRRRASAWTPK